MVRRMLRAAGRRVGNGDYPDLADLVALRDVLEDAIAEAVEGMREQTPPCSWREVGLGLGTTKQAAQQRYGGTSGTRTDASVHEIHSGIADRATG